MDDSVMATEGDSMKEMRDRELKLQGQLRHLRTWLSVVNNRVQQLHPMAVKNSKRLYVGGIPPDTIEEELRSYLEELMVQVGVPVSAGNPVTSFKITLEKGFAFIEFRCVEEASNALALSGVEFKGVHLKIRRPSNYDAAVGLLLGPAHPDPTLDLAGLNLVKSVTEDSNDKIFVGGLPNDWGESQVKELLQPFGALRTFNLIKDKATGNSKGYAFCEFFDEAVTDVVIRSLNQTSAGTRILTVKRALDGDSAGGGGGGGGGSKRMGGPTGLPGNGNSLLALLGVASSAGYLGQVPQPHQQGYPVGAGGFPFAAAQFGTQQQAGGQGSLWQ